MPGPVPEKFARQDNDPAGMLRLRVPADMHLTYMVYFAQTIVAGNPEIRPAGSANILRVPNRPDLYKKGEGVMLSAPDGAVLPPNIKSLSDTDVLPMPELVPRPTRFLDLRAPGFDFSSCSCTGYTSFMNSYSASITSTVTK